MPAPKNKKGATKPKSMVAKVKADLKARLKTLNDQIGPLVKERDEIQELLGEKPQAVAPQQSKPKATTQGRPTRSRKNGRREDEFVGIVRDNPGIRVSQAAEKMKLEPNYLYRVAREAVSRKKVVKEGKGYKVAA